ncbi:VOC family protein [Leifsonia sp. NPDC058230]|uniref:VOC family protein n=1 Tax=Leifsonia sp. NPDC058230 TaxID=3346391 RepID=UPI0036DA5BE4
MTVLTTHRLGEPCWIDYASSDLDASREFYASLFGWEADVAAPEYGGYVTFRSNGHPVAGMGTAMEGIQPNVWTTYLLVEDASATESAAVEAHAEVSAPTMTVGDQGAMAIVTDPGGAAIGLWQPNRFRGFEVVGEAGAPTWHELYARDYAAQVEFYTKTFGWSTQVLGDTADFRYSTYGPEGAPVGGVFDADKMLPDGVASHWTIYFGVDDVDAACARVVELGGSVIRDPWDSEFGRFAQANDPLGGLFFLQHLQGR